MAELPTGTVTFLFTDIEGSTRHLEEEAEAMREHPAPIEAVYPDVVNIGGSAFGHVPRVKRLPPKAAT